MDSLKKQMDIKTDREKDSGICLEMTLESPEWTHEFLCVCVTVNQYCSMSGAIRHLYAYRKQCHCLPHFTLPETLKKKQWRENCSISSKMNQEKSHYKMNVIAIVNSLLTILPEDNHLNIQKQVL